MLESLNSYAPTSIYPTDNPLSLTMWLRSARSAHWNDTKQKSSVENRTTGTSRRGCTPGEALSRDRPACRFVDSTRFVGLRLDRPNQISTTSMHLLGVGRSAVMLLFQRSVLCGLFETSRAERSMSRSFFLVRGRFRSRTFSLGV